MWPAVAANAMTGATPRPWRRSIYLTACACAAAPHSKDADRFDLHRIDRRPKSRWIHLSAVGDPPGEGAEPGPQAGQAAGEEVHREDEHGPQHEQRLRQRPAEHARQAVDG